MLHVINALLPLAELSVDGFERTLAHLTPEPARGRPWSLPRRQRVLLACIALRANLTIRENRNDPIHYRGSTVQTWCQRHGRVLADGGYRGIPELVTPRFRRNRIVRDHGWRRHRRRRARVEHAIASLKNWRVLRDHRRRGHHLATTLAAVAFLHNLQLYLRDNP